MTVTVGVARVCTITGIGGGGVVGEGGVSAVEHLSLPVEGGRFRVRGLRLHRGDDYLRASHGRVIAGVVPLVLEVGQVLCNVLLQVTDSLVQHLLCV